MKDYITYGSIFVVALLLIGGAAVWEGSLTDRWEWTSAEDPKLDSMKEGIRNIPHTVGNWSGDLSTERREMDDIIAKEAGAEESLARTYTHVGVSRPVSMNIICGFARKVAIHTPDACYKGAGFHIVGDIEKVEFPYPPNPLLQPAQGDSAAPETKPGEEKEPIGRARPKTGYFKTAVFERETHLGVERQRVFWGWKSADSGWEAPELPRQRWTKGPLAKLYLSTPEGPEDKLADNPAYLFAQSLLSELDYLLSGEFSVGEAAPPPPPEVVGTRPAPPAASNDSPADLGKPVSDSVSPFISTPIIPDEDDGPLFPEDVPAVPGGLESLVPDTPNATEDFLPDLPLPETTAPPAFELEPPPAADTGSLPDADINRLPPLPI